MSEKRFVWYATSVEEYVESMENRNTREKLSEMCNCSSHVSGCLFNFPVLQLDIDHSMA